jgi:hypothetical protein
VNRPRRVDRSSSTIRDFLATGRGKASLIGAGLVVVFAAGWFLGSASHDDTVTVTSAPLLPATSSTSDQTTIPTPSPDQSSSSSGSSSSSHTGSGSPASSSSTASSDETGSTPAAVSQVSVPSGTIPAAPVPRFSCPAATKTVSNADELKSALAGARPGDVIVLKNGVYEGNFTAASNGSAAAPIYLCGGKGAVLQSDGPKGGYVLHFDNASYWRASGFTVRNGQKGIMVDAGHHIGLQGIFVEDTGDEAVHLRKNSTYNVVRGLTIRKTGHRRDKFGEGVYIGTAQSNWPDITGGQPDHSDHNFVLDNVISQTTAESVDIKEGTSDGVVAGNTFDGGSLSGADSWVDVKGNGWLIAGNHGHATPKDGFQTHVIVDGWGDKNVFTGNIADLAGGSGVGYYLHEPLSNQVDCNNKVSGGELSNYPCHG